MKKILYRNSSSEFQSGLFISFQTLISTLGLICFLITYIIYISNLSFWFQLPLFLIFAVISVKCSEAYNFKKINLTNDAESYIESLSKSKLKLFQISDEIIGEYEFRSIIKNSNQLIQFYKECQIKIEKIKEKDRSINIGLLELVSKDFEEKIYYLKKVKNFEDFLEISSDTSVEEYSLRRSSILKKNQKLIYDLDQLIIVVNKMQKISLSERLEKIKEKSEESYGFLKSNI